MTTGGVTAVHGHCETTAEARKKMQQGKGDPVFSGMITTCTPSPYGGVRVHSEPAE